MVLLRLPSFFEPPWHTDEGIFAAVAQRVLEGGSLYSDAWESKPPLFLYLYVAIFKVFGPGVFGLRLVATLFAIGTQIALFAIALHFMSRNRALVASACCGVLLGVPFWEGTLALTETFTVLPAALGVLALVAWDARPAGRGPRVETALLFTAGVCFGLAFLLRQTSLAAPAAAGIWLLLRNRPWIRAGLFSGAGFFAVVIPVVAAFYLGGSAHWFWDANVGFFFKYVPSGQELPLGTRPVIALPFAITVVALLLARRKGQETPPWSLPALWLTLTLAGAMLTGRPYSHYMLQTFLPLSLLLAMLPLRIRDGDEPLVARHTDAAFRFPQDWGLGGRTRLVAHWLRRASSPPLVLRPEEPLVLRPSKDDGGWGASGRLRSLPGPATLDPSMSKGRSKEDRGGLGRGRFRGGRFRLTPAHLFVAALVFEWVYVVVPMFGGNVLAMHYTRGPSYYANFAGWATGLRDERAYNDYFDRRVEFTRSLENALEANAGAGEKVYIWGEYPWAYALADVEPATRYMTSFYVLLLPYLDVNLAATLNEEKPAYIAVMNDARPRLPTPSPIIDQRWHNATRGLQAVLARDYHHVATVGRGELYRRSPERLTPTPSSGIVYPFPDEAPAEER